MTLLVKVLQLDPVLVLSCTLDFFEACDLLFYCLVQSPAFLNKVLGPEHASLSENFKCVRNAFADKSLLDLGWFDGFCFSLNHLCSGSCRCTREHKILGFLELDALTWQHNVDNTRHSGFSTGQGLERSDTCRNDRQRLSSCGLNVRIKIVDDVDRRSFWGDQSLRSYFQLVRNKVVKLAIARKSLLTLSQDRLQEIFLDLWA